MIEVVDRERPVAVEELVRHRRPRRRRHLAGRVDEVELELGRDHRPQPVRREPLADRGQRPPRIAEIGRAVLRQHPERQERGRAPEPVHRQEPPPRRLAAPVDVALLVDQRVAGHVLAPDVEAGDRIGHPHRPLEHLRHLRHRHPLAAQDAVQIADRRPQAGDVGPALEPGQGGCRVQDRPQADALPPLLAPRPAAAKACRNSASMTVTTTATSANTPIPMPTTSSSHCQSAQLPPAPASAAAPQRAAAFSSPASR